MKVSKFLFVGLFALVPGTLWLSAQGPANRGRGMRNYNSAAEITARGTIEEVKEYTSPAGWSGTHLMIKTSDHGTLDVHLGPSNFLTEKGFKFKKGEQIEITGSKTGTDGLVARKVEVNGRTLELRNSNGVPLWSGGMMGGGRGMRGGMMGGMGPMGMGGGMRGRMGMPAGNANQTAAGTAGSALSQGQAVFAADCAACHNAASTAKKVGPGLKGLFEHGKLVNGQKVTDANVRDLLNNGIDGMPPYRNTLNSQQMDALMTYLKSL